MAARVRAENPAEQVSMRLLGIDEALATTASASPKTVLQSVYCKLTRKAQCSASRESETMNDAAIKTESRATLSAGHRIVTKDRAITSEVDAMFYAFEKFITTPSLQGV
eukprot:TRINITY_DN91781_c0_g1_i1.p2 TRINITY_DN91781_c0_g1~~TRINITY_DN91781_c0_g1_i1.p2  ORF type:complete len:109 (-),score=22.39 TRINITY_DN91781_c0_g1_i1:424-750(-)